MNDSRKRIIDIATALSENKRFALQDLVEALIKWQAEGKSKGSLRDGLAEEKLRAAYAAFLDVKAFQVGQIVRWKRMLKNTKFPDYGEPLVVMELVEPPIIDNREDSGSQYFRQRLDMVAGFLDDDDELVRYYFDSRRLEPYTDDVDVEPPIAAQNVT
jgi:hypothetical protein